VNYAPLQSQGYVRLSFADLGGHSWMLEDQLGGPSFERDGDELNSRGLYVDLAPWRYHAFALKAQSAPAGSPPRRPGMPAVAV